MISEVYGLFVRPLKLPLWRLVHRLTGHRLSLTATYHDLSIISAEFPASAEKVEYLLPAPDLRVMRCDNHRTVISVMFNAMRHIDVLWPYNEVAICVPVEYHGRGDVLSRFGYFYLYLPVTTEDARWPGVENFGFPKFLASIEIGETNAAHYGRLVADGREILALEVPKVATQVAPLEMFNFTLLNGQLVQSTFKAQGQAARCDSGDGVYFRLGDHPIADNLRAVEMETRPVRFTYAPQLSAVLSKPEPIASHAGIGA